MNLLQSIALTATLTLAAQAQDRQNPAPSAQPKQEIEVAAPRPTTTTTNIISTNTIPTKPKEPVVTYSGVANDLRKSTNRFKIFSLRRPANLKEDEANLVRGLRTEGGAAVKIFAIDF